MFCIGMVRIEKLNFVEEVDYSFDRCGFIWRILVWKNLVVFLFIEIIYKIYREVEEIRD